MVRFNWALKQRNQLGMQRLLLLFLLFGGPSIIISAHYAQGVDDKNGIHFLENKWSEAIKNGATEKKYIFLEFYASWCSPCRQLRRTTFQNKEVAAFFNQTFVNVALDVEKGDGATLAESMNVQAIPTLLILSPNGKPVLKRVGYLGPDELINFGKTAIHAKPGTLMSR
ncbi:MAG TPA: thioredoxin family protein [Chitinophagaceae bacterium]|jgi:thioredoxin|nr:thioredoxin family protein [Chitinophagaceae bacterium]